MKIYVKALLVLCSTLVNAYEYKSLMLPKIKVVPIEDSKTGRQYELYTKLPDSYEKIPEKKHPVIYITDAMWHLEILSGSAEYVIEGAILIGISWQKGLDAERKHASRFQDYTLVPSNNPKAKYNRGQASNHLTFIRNDVIKYLENNYRADPNARTYFGYSLGGEFGAYILMSQPDSFKNYILGSPTVSEMEAEYIFSFEPKGSKEHKDLDVNLYVSYGELEAKLAKNAEEFLATLRSRNYPNLSIEQGLIKNADHGKAFPMTAVRIMYWLSSVTGK